jgi:hypothetical protein
MPDELETLLRLVAEGKLSPEEAAPLVARLQRDGRREEPAEAWAADERTARVDGKDRDRKHTGRWGTWNQREPFVQKVLADRRLKILVTEHGHNIVNLAMPLAAAGYAIDRIPGLSDDDRMRIAEAIRQGMTGSIVEARDDDDEVRITIE